MFSVPRVCVVHEFYMEQFSIDFGYISKYSPQVSGLNLCSCYSKHNCTRPSSDPPSSSVIWGEGGLGVMETRRNIPQPEVTESIILFVVDSRDVPPQNTHIYILPAPLIPRKIRVDKFSCISLITRFQKLKVSPASPDVRVEADLLKCAATQA